MTYREKVEALSFQYVQPRHREPLRWLLLQLADWADNDPDIATVVSDVFLPSWKQERLQYLIRMCAFTAEATRRGQNLEKGHKHALERLSRVWKAIREQLSCSPWAGKYAQPPAPDTFPGKEYCGKYQNRTRISPDSPAWMVSKSRWSYTPLRTVSHCHRRSGLWVWHELPEGKKEGWWFALSKNTRGYPSFGYSPAQAVASYLTGRRSRYTRRIRLRTQVFSRAEVQQMSGHMLRDIARARGLPVPPRGARLDDLRAQIAGGQRGLLDLLR